MAAPVHVQLRMCHCADWHSLTLLVCGDDLEGEHDMCAGLCFFLLSLCACTYACVGGSSVSLSLSGWVANTSKFVALLYGVKLPVCVPGNSAGCPPGQSVVCCHCFVEQATHNCHQVVWGTQPPPVPD